MADDFSFQITEKVGEISVSKTGWTLELNKVSWADVRQNSTFAAGRRITRKWEKALR